MQFQLQFNCPDKVGILYIITNILKSCNCNILSTTQVVEQHICKGVMIIDDPYDEMQNVELLLKNGMPKETQLILSAI